MSRPILRIILSAIASLAAQATFVHDAATIVDFGKLKIHLCTPEIIRVAYSASDVTPDRVASTVIRTWLDEVPYVRQDDSPSVGKTTITTTVLSIVVDTTLPTLDVCFYDRSALTPTQPPHALLLCESGRSLNATGPWGDAGASASSTAGTSQEWRFPEGSDEALFGGGSVQPGLMNFRDLPLQLVQRNTEAAIPFFLSSNGWGLLWDSTASSWLNAPSESDKVAMAPCTEQGFTFPFTAKVDGVHSFTGVYGAHLYKAPASNAANVALTWSEASGGGASGGVMDYTAERNMPPVVSGRTDAGLKAGVEYALRWTTSGSLCGGAEAAVYVTEPGHGGGGFSLSAEDDDFVDYYFMRPGQHQSFSGHGKVLEPVGQGDDAEEVGGKFSANTSGSGSGSGSDVERVVGLYREASGSPPLYPKWVFGFWQCKEHYASSEELLTAVANFRERHLPLDAIVQDWLYWGELGWGPVWDTSPNLYPDPAGLVEQLHASNVRFMVSVWAKFDNEACLDAIRATGDNLLDAANNTEHYMDAWDPATSETFFSLVNETMFSFGVDAIWLDGSEPEFWPHLGHDLYPNGHGDDAVGPPVPGSRLFNGYSLQETASLQAGLLSAYPDQRVFSLTRASWGGQQRTGGALWSGDTNSTWDTLRRQVTAVLNFGLSGMPWWSMDIGGFFRPPNQYADEDFRALLTRWFQLGCFVPVYRVHGTNGANVTYGTEYWLYGDEVYSNVNATNNLRHRLVPYIYSAAYRVSSEGYTLTRHLAFDFARALSGPELTSRGNDEFMFGDALLVAPVVDATDQARQARDVFLPGDGGWVDFWTGELLLSAGDGTIASGKVLEAYPALTATVPLFGRCGTLLPLAPFGMQSVGTAADVDPVEVRLFFGKGMDASFDLYEDDGTTRMHETEAAFSVIPLRFNAAAQTFTAGARQGKGFTGMREVRTFKVVVVRPGFGVGIGDEAAPDATFTYSGEAMTVPLNILRHV